VAGFDPVAHGFFWLAGQGGNGIQTAPALSQLAADIILNKTASFTDSDTSNANLITGLSPARFS
jgi:D-arginine dehydrogenase